MAQKVQRPSFSVSFLYLLLQDALQYRMSVQEDSVLQLKQELLRSSMDKEDLEGQNVSNFKVPFAVARCLI